MSTRIEDNNRNLYIMTLDRSRVFELYAAKLQNVINREGSVNGIRTEMEHLIEERNIKCREIDRVFLIHQDRILRTVYDCEEELI